MIKEFNLRKIKIIKNKIYFWLIIYFEHFFGTCIYNFNINYNISKILKLYKDKENNFFLFTLILIT